MLNWAGIPISYGSLNGLSDFNTDLLLKTGKVKKFHIIFMELSSYCIHINKYDL